MGRTSDGKAPRFHYAFVIVFCCIVIVNIPMGLFYGCSGLFFTPVAAYLGVPTASFTLYFSISNLAILLGLPAVARIVDRFDIRAVAAGSSALLAAVNRRCLRSWRASRRPSRFPEAMPGCGGTDCSDCCRRRA